LQCSQNSGHINRDNMNKVRCESSITTRKERRKINELETIRKNIRQA